MFRMIYQRLRENLFLMLVSIPKIPIKLIQMETALRWMMLWMLLQHQVVDYSLSQ